MRRRTPARSVGLLMFIAALLAEVNTHADTYPRQSSIDAVHYVFRLSVDDTSDRIAGETRITLRLLQPVSAAVLDLASDARLITGPP